MTVTTFEKSDFTWYGISIIPNNRTVDIFLLFKDLGDGHKFFNLITKENKHPSFYCILQPDSTHVLKIDFSFEALSDDYITVPCNLTVDTYDGLNRLKENHGFKIIIGTEQKINGQVQVQGTNMSFVPKIVEYVSISEQSKSSPEIMN